MTGESGGEATSAPAGGAGPAGPEGDPPEAVAIMGPTATGKTDLAIRVARRVNGEVVSVDSRQAYRGMEVGTAAPGPEARAAVPHHGVAFLEPDERYGAGRFARLARSWLEEIRGRGRFPVLAGGTGFFLRALTDPVFEEPEMEADRRDRLRRWLDDLPAERIREWARRLDPGLEDELETLDPQRCARTLELSLLSGRPLTWWQEHGSPEAPPLEALVVVLELPSDLHRERIRQRTEQQLDEGWVQEVRALREAGYGEQDPPLTALGYRVVAALERGELDRREAVDRIVQETWQYARRQRTWFRHQVPETALRMDARRGSGELAGRVLEELLERGAPVEGDGRNDGRGAVPVGRTERDRDAGTERDRDGANRT